MYCLRKKNIFIYFFIFNFFSFFIFFFFFSGNTFCFHYIPPKKQKFFLDTSISCCYVPTTFSQLFKKMHKEIHNSQLPFWFHKLIQSHMCYTGLELEHCKLYSWILLFSIVGYKKEQATQMTWSEFHQHTVFYPLYAFVIFCFVSSFWVSHRSEAHRLYFIHIQNKLKYNLGGARDKLSF